MILWWAIRIGRSVLVLGAVMALVVQITSMLPGDPALVLLGQDSTPQQRASLRSQLGLDLSYPDRLRHWVGGLLTGNLGTSFDSHRPVLETLLGRIPVTAELVIASEVLAVAIAVPLGLATAYAFRGVGDRIASLASFVLLAMPSFVVGLALIYLFAVRLHWLPASGWVAPADGIGAHVRSLVLPVTTMALVEAAVYLRTFRGAVLSTLNEPFVYAASSRGLSPARLLWQRVARPVSGPLTTLVGLQLGIALGGTLVIESLFAIPGVGRLALNALAHRDIPLLQGTVFFAALAVVVLSLLVDIALSVLDPRSTRAKA